MSSSEFKDDLEQKLVNVYATAKALEEQVSNGTYTPLTRRKRLAVADLDPQVILEVRSPELRSKVAKIHIIPPNLSKKESL